MATNVLAFSVEFKMTEPCCTCGVAMVMTADMERELRRSHRWFYCINGHCQSYRAKSREEILQAELAEKEKLLAFERQRATTNFEARMKAEKEAKKLKRRTSGGVCPCCNRTFITLGRHMKTKHPEFVADAKPRS